VIHHEAARDEFRSRTLTWTGWWYQRMIRKGCPRPRHHRSASEERGVKEWGGPTMSIAAW